MAASKTKKASGENIEEWQRRTAAIKIRLPAAVAATVRERAAAKEMTLSAYVAERVARDATMRCEKCGDPPGGPDFCVGARYGSIEESGEDEDGETVYSATWVSGIEPGDVCDACVCVCSECDAIREWPRR